VNALNPAIPAPGTSPIVRLLCGGLLSLMLPAKAMEMQPEIYFVEPGSGRKVAAYGVDLPVAADRKEHFAVPDDCAEIEARFDRGEIYTGRIIDRRIWRKVENDCRYFGFLHRHPMQDITDHVSGYDFRNADLADLPIDLRCTAAGSAAGPCDPTATDAFGMLRHFPLAEPVPAGETGAVDTPCTLRDGLFHGRLFVGPGGIACEGAPARPTLRLIAIDFADINGDRVLDAVLRFVPIGPGAHRGPLILPLTRFSADERFSVPQPLFSPPDGG